MGYWKSTSRGLPADHPATTRIFFSRPPNTYFFSRPPKYLFFNRPSQNTIFFASGEQKHHILIFCDTVKRDYHDKWRYYFSRPPKFRRNFSRPSRFRKVVSRLLRIQCFSRTSGCQNFNRPPRFKEIFSRPSRFASRIQSFSRPTVFRIPTSKIQEEFLSGSPRCSEFQDFWRFIQ